MIITRKLTILNKNHVYILLLFAKIIHLVGKEVVLIFQLQIPKHPAGI